MKKGTCPKCQSTEVFSNEFGGLKTSQSIGSYLYADAALFTVETMVCGNCGYYVKTKFIDDCMKKYEQVTPPEVDPAWVDTGDGGGYCTEWDIPCTASRTCDTWEPGGPITDAKKTNPFEGLNIGDE